MAIYKYKRGQWRISVDLGKDATGKRIRRTKLFAGSKKAAEAEAFRFLEEERRKLAAGVTRDYTVDSWAAYWISDIYTPSVSPTTLEESRKKLASYILPYMGHLLMSDVQPRHIRELLAHLLEKGGQDKTGLSERTVHHVYALLRLMFNAAVQDEVIARNPVLKVPAPKVPAKEMQTFSIAEVVSLLDYCKREKPLFYLPILLAVETGFRRGEIYGLQWPDVDFEAHTISVRRAMVVLKGQKFTKDPKTARSRRKIAVSEHVIKELQGHKSWQAGMGFSSAFIIVNENGQPASPDWLSSQFGRVCAAAGIKPLRFHDLRHTHATILSEAGVDSVLISRRLGHSGVTVTDAIYNHHRALSKEAADKLAKLFGR